MDRNTIERIARQVIEQMGHLDAAPLADAPLADVRRAYIPVEVSARHVHLCGENFARLFGKNAQLEQERALSQPGQFLAKQRVKLVTPRGCIEHVAVLGPLREKTQAELSLADGRTLGLKLPVNQSGDLNGACDVHIFSDNGAVLAKSSAIAARAHIHMTRADAGARGLKDNQTVRVRVASRRPAVFEHVIVRVSDSFALAMHIDFDEANAAAYESGVMGEILSGVAAPVPEVIRNDAGPEQVFCGVVSQNVIEKWVNERRARVLIGKKTIVTPLAIDLCREYGILLKRGE